MFYLTSYKRLHIDSHLVTLIDKSCNDQLL